MLCCVVSCYVLQCYAMIYYCIVCDKLCGKWRVFSPYALSAEVDLNPEFHDAML